MKFLVVGCGSIGRRHLRNLAALGERDLMGVDPDPERREAAGKESGARPFAAFDEELAQRADVVFVTLPSALHLDVALTAARAGCHLFIEKPLACAWEGVDELIELVRSRGLTGFVGSNWKFHPAFGRMKGLLNGGAIGRVLTARFLFGQYLPDWHPWEDYRRTYSARKSLGGGVIFDSHELDYAGWLLGPVEELTCSAARVSNLEIETEDVASLLLRFRSGAVAQIQLDYLHRNYTRRYEFCGTEGTVVWDVNTRAVELYQAAEEKWRRWEIPRSYEGNTMYLEEVRHFLNCLNGRENPLTPLERGREVLELMLAAHRSSREKRTVSLRPLAEAEAHNRIAEVR
ncbi:MAG: Gfo/Idh/MocA family protein [Nitrospinota bacterium]